MVFRAKAFVVLILSFLLCNIDRVHGQDSHYWNNSYSAGGFFIPGSVVAFSGDSSVLFYNPALLVYSDKNKLSVNATAYYHERLNIINGAGNGYDLKSVNSGSNPLLVSGNFHPKGLGKINIAYGLISDPTYDFHVSQRRDDIFQVLDDSYSPGPETYVGQMKFGNTVRRQSAVAGLGIQITPKLSGGFYVEGNYVKQQYDLSFIGRALVNPPGNANNPLVSNDFEYFASYTHIGIKGRLGLAYTDNVNHFGLLITTPSAKISGKGLIQSDMVLNNISLPGVTINLIANARQEDLSSVVKQPLSIGAGYSRRIKKVTVYGGAEYFFAIKEYNTLSPRAEYFIRPDSGYNSIFTPALLKLKDARKDVINFTIGLSYDWKYNTTLFTAFRTDQSFYSNKKFNDELGFAIHTSNWNIYHTQVGINIKRVRSHMRIGVDMAMGRNKNYEQILNFDDPNEENFLLGNTGFTKATYFSGSLLLSYIHLF